MTKSNIPKPAVPVSLPLKDIDWAALVPQISRANRSLAAYNGLLSHLPNAALLLAPLTTQEAVLSSRIEGTLATMTEVLQFEAGELPIQGAKLDDIEEVLNYRAALDIAMKELDRRPFTLNLLLKLHEILLGGVRGQNKGRGTFRKQQNYIGSIVGGKESIRFTPPAWEALPKALDEWEKYYHSDEHDPIVQFAVVHAQFEFLHPFLDGNGRLGRILIPLFLFEKGILQRPYFYLSEYIETNRDEYIDLLHGITKGKAGWDHWIRFFLLAVDTQAQRNSRKAEAMLSLYSEMKLRFLEITRSQYAIPLLDFIFSTPIFQTAQIQWPGSFPSQPTLTTMLSALHRGNVLTPVREGSGRRPYIWALNPLIEIAERIFSV